MKLYKITQHAFERYWERVKAGASKQVVINWVSNAIENGIYVGESEGNEIYRFENYKIVVSKDTVITISYFNVFSNKDLSDEIHRIALSKVNRELKRTYKEKKKMEIMYHEACVRELKAKNPNVRKIIREDVDSLNRAIIKLKDDLIAIEKTAKKYLISEDKLFKGDA